MRTLSRPPAEICVYPDPADLAAAAAADFQARARARIAECGRFLAVLAGGSTPRALYQRLAADHAGGSGALRWDRIHCFFGDERNVPADHADSNYRMARETLLDRVPIPPGNVHRWATEAGPEAAVREYDSLLRGFFASRAGEMPRFDLVLLGMGADGHTASLFPGTTALGETTRAVCSTWVSHLNAHRLTLTLPALNAAAAVEFLVAGADKAARLTQIFGPGPVPPGGPAPARRVQPARGTLTWRLDEAAAAGL